MKGYRNKAVEREGHGAVLGLLSGTLSTSHCHSTSYLLEHDQMGEFEIFLVPVSQSERGFRYEAVFNYFKRTVKSEE